MKLVLFLRDGGAKSPCKWFSLSGIYKKGKLYANDFWGRVEEERLYVHFLKRAMNVKVSRDLEAEERLLIMPNEIIIGANKMTATKALKITTMNIVNPERCNRVFWVTCGKIIKYLRKAGLWKRIEKKE